MGAQTSRVTVEEVAATFARRFGIKVSFEGSGAYSTADTIILPRLSIENAEQERMLYGLLVHEAAHIKYSDFKAFTGISCGVIKELVNIIEDTRIESLMCRDYMGAYENLAWVNQTICKRLEPLVESAPSQPKLNIIKAYIHTRCNHLVMDYPGSGSLAWRFYRELTCLIDERSLYDLNELLTEVPSCGDIHDVTALCRRIYSLMGRKNFFIPDFSRMALRAGLCSQFDRENYRRLADMFGQDFKDPVICPAPVHLQVDSCQSVISRLGLSLEEHEVNQDFLPEFISPFLPEFLADDNLNDCLMAARYSRAQLEDATELATMAAGNEHEAEALKKLSGRRKKLNHPAPVNLSERLEHAGHDSSGPLQRQLIAALLEDLAALPDLPEEQREAAAAHTERLAAAAARVDSSARAGIGGRDAGAAGTQISLNLESQASMSPAATGGHEGRTISSTFYEGPEVHPVQPPVGEAYRALACVQDRTVRAPDAHVLPLEFHEDFIEGQLDILRRSEHPQSNPFDFSTPYLYAGPLARPDVKELTCRFDHMLSARLRSSDEYVEHARTMLPGLSEEQYRNLLQVCEGTEHISSHLRPLDLRHSAFQGPLRNIQETAQALITMSRFFNEHKDEIAASLHPDRVNCFLSFCSVPHERFVQLCTDRTLMDYCFVNGPMRLKSACPSLELITRLSLECAARPYDWQLLAQILNIHTAGSPVQLLQSMRSFQLSCARHIKILWEDDYPEARNLEELAQLNSRAVSNYRDFDQIIKARIMTPSLLEKSRRIREEGLCMPVFQYDQGKDEIDCLGWNSCDGNIDLQGMAQHRRALIDRTYEARRNARYRRRVAILKEQGLYSPDIMDPDLVLDGHMYCRDSKGRVYYKYYYERTVLTRRLMLSFGLQRADDPVVADTDEPAASGSGYTIGAAAETGVAAVPADAAAAQAAAEDAQAVAAATRVGAAYGAGAHGSTPLGQCPVACAVAPDHFTTMHGLENSDLRAMENRRNARSLYEGRRRPLQYQGFYLSELFIKPVTPGSYVHGDAYDPCNGLRHPVYIEPESTVMSEWQRHTRMTSALRQLLPWEIKLAHLELVQKERPEFNMRDPRMENSFADVLREYYYMTYRLADMRCQFMGRQAAKSSRSKTKGSVPRGADSSGGTAGAPGSTRVSSGSAGVTGSTAPAARTSVRSGTAFSGRTFTSEKESDIVHDLKNLRYDLRLEMMANIDRLRAAGNSMVKVIDWHVMNNPQVNNHGLHSGLMKDIARAQRFFLNSTRALEGNMGLALLTALQSLTSGRSVSRQQGHDLNVRRAQFLPLGEQRIFTGEADSFGHDLSVHLLVDISLSMREGHNRPPVMKFVCPDSAGFIACQAALAISRALSGVEGAACEVTFFPGPFEGSACLNVKRACEHINRVERFFFQLPRLGTPTDEALMYALHSIMRTDARRRVILMITDGLPDNSESTIHALKTARARGVEVLCAGILKTAEEFQQQARQIFPDMVTVENLNELPLTMTRLLLDYGQRER